MDRAAVHDRVIVGLSPPALGDLAQAAVIVIGLDIIRRAELASPNALAKAGKARALPQYQVGRQLQLRPRGKRLPDIGQLLLEQAHRFLDEDVFSRRQRGHHLTVMRPVI